ncbi:MAG: DUF6092 family protein [Dehalobacterium sp.]
MDKEKVYDLLGYITSSAKELLVDPPKYGPFRLINVASRFITILEEEGMADDFMLELKDYIDENKFCAESDEDEFRYFLNNLVNKIAEKTMMDLS